MLQFSKGLESQMDNNWGIVHNISGFLRDREEHKNDDTIILYEVFLFLSHLFLILISLLICISAIL